MLNIASKIQFYKKCRRDYNVYDNTTVIIYDAIDKNG
jgi:hypothetical protein